MKKKTMMGKLASLLFALALVWGGVACTQPETPAPTTYTITFDSGVESISVEEGAVAKNLQQSQQKMVMNLLNGLTVQKLTIGHFQ